MAVIDVTGRYPLAPVWWRGTYTAADITDIVLHHTAMGELPANASLDDELAVLDCIYAFHVNTRGFGGIGYHGIAFPSGRAYKTCPLNRWGAHVAFENDHLWGFSAAGDYSDSVPPIGTLRGLAELIALADRTRAAWLSLRPHLYWKGTSCPGAQWPEWVPQLRAQAEEDDMNKAEVQAIVRDELTKFEFAAYDGNVPKSGKRTLVTWAWSLIRHEQTPHGTSGAYTDAQAVRAVKNKLS